MAPGIIEGAIDLYNPYASHCNHGSIPVCSSCNLVKEGLFHQKIESSFFFSFKLRNFWKII